MKLIDADAAKRRVIEEISKILPELNVRTFHIAMGVAEIFDCEDDFPTIEAEPVRHGHIVKKKRVIGRVKHHKCPECSHTWQKDKRHKIDEWLCSECGKVLAHNYTNYCPNCGAKMD